MYKPTDRWGGRPNFDEILMVKLLVLQALAWIIGYRARTPSIRQNFIYEVFWDFHKTIPLTIPQSLYFRERLAGTGKDQEIWDELQRQLGR